MKKTILCALVCATILALAGCSQNEESIGSLKNSLENNASDEIISSEEASYESYDMSYSSEENYTTEEDYATEEDYSEGSGEEYSDDDWDYLYDEYDYGDWWGFEDYEEDYSDISEDNSGIDWSTVPAISNDDEAKQYFMDCTDQLMTTIPVCYSDGYSLTSNQFLMITSLPWVNENVYSNDGDICLVYDVIYYPGTRVADAYLSNDTSGLSNDEMQLYNVAAEIIDKAKTYETAMMQELYIHDIICSKVTYYTETLDKKMPRFCTAIGALIDGRANCQGYSDAFYMLMKMAGFEVGKQSGNANGGHVWNVVNINGTWAAVDVTWDDDAFTMNDMNFVVYTYFNAGADIIGMNHSWESYEEVYPITQQTDGTYFYYTPEANEQYFGFHATDLTSVGLYIAQQLMSGDMFVYIKCDNFTTTPNDVISIVSSNLSANGYSGTYSVNVQTIGNTSFVYVDAAKRS